MPKKIVDEMTAAGSGATIGPIQPLGVDKEKVEEMLRRNPDIKEGHVAVFARGAGFFLREDFQNHSRVEDFDGMATLVREEVARQAVRSRMYEVVRKKGDKFVLYAPNTGKKHKPKPIATFTTKLAAKRAELAKFPPKDPEKLERLRKQVEKLMKDPKERTKADQKDRMMQESHSRDLLERAIIGASIRRDIEAIHEGLFRQEQEPSEYDQFVKSLSKKAVDNDKGYQRRQKNYDKQAEVAMLKMLKSMQRELGVRIKPGEAKKHTDGKTYLPFSIKADCEIKPVYLYVDGTKVKVEISDEANAALTKCAPETADKIRSRLSTLGEGADSEDPGLVQARGQRDQYIKKITKFIDNFMAKLSPVAMTILKQLWAKKYRKLGGANA